MITLAQLAQRLAATTGVTTEEAQTYLTALCEAVKQQLLDGAPHVNLPGIGTFSAEDDGTVVLVVDDKLAEEVNEPFSMFYPIELSDAEDESIATSSSTVGQTEASEKAEESDPVKPMEIIEPVTPKEPEKAEPEAIEAAAEPHNDEVMPTEEAISIKEPEEEVVSYQQPAVAVPAKSYRMGWLAIGILIGVVIGWLAASLYYMAPKTVVSEAEVVTTPTEAETDSTVTVTTDTIRASEQMAVPQETAVKRDTITTKRYITHMAKEYYGNRAFWVYIYEANRDVLGHPERTLPGTVVIIPDADTLEVEPKNADHLKKARLLGAEIYSRFQ